MSCFKNCIENLRTKQRFSIHFGLLNFRFQIIFPQAKTLEVTEEVVNQGGRQFE
jgi:hypothetical protein